MDEHILTDIIAALDGFSLSPSEYVPDDGITLTRKAVEHVIAALPFLEGKPIDMTVSLLVKARCHAIMVQGVSWERLPGGGDSPIACTIGGRAFSGRASIRPKTVRVETQSGTGKSSSTCTIHKWSPEVFTQGPFVGSPPNEDGTECAKELFIELCYKKMSEEKGKG